MWLNNRKFNIRNSSWTNMSTFVILNGTGVNNIANSMSGLFGDFYDFGESISGLYVYPFKFNTSRTDKLVTTKGTSENVIAGEVGSTEGYYNMGHTTILRYFNNFADYKGYTSLRLFLPMLGYVDLDINEFMGRQLAVRLAIDFTNGKGMYMICRAETDVQLSTSRSPTADEDKDLVVVATFECQIGKQIPWGNTNADNIARNAIMSTLKMGTALATRGLSLMAPTNNTTTTENVSYSMSSTGVKTARTSGSRTTTQTTSSHIPEKSRLVSEVFNNSIDAANYVPNTGSTDRVNESGLNYYMTGRVQVIINRPKMKPVDNTYDKLYGRPLGEVRKLSTLVGYTEISAIHIEGIGFENITRQELGMLEKALTSGIILPNTPLN